MRRVFGVCLILGACAGRAAPPRAIPRPTAVSPPPTSVGPKVVELEPLRIEVSPDDPDRARVYDARALLDEGNDALLLRRWDEAIAIYERLLRDFPESRLAPAAEYNIGLALEGKGDLAGAVERYRRVLHAAPPATSDYVDAQYRVGSLLAELDRHGEAVPVWEQVLRRDDLSPEDRIEALARLGFSLVELADYAGAEKVLRSAIDYHRSVVVEKPLESEFYVAMAQYYLADIPRRQFLAIPLRLPAEQLDRDVEQKSELVLLARERYIKTVEYKEPYWSTAAVFRLGEMHKAFWDDFMAVPIPSDLNEAERKAYVQAVNEEPQLRKLLEKAVMYHERNLALARNANAKTVWTEASEKQLKEVYEILAKQSRGELIQPGQPPAHRPPGSPDAMPDGPPSAAPRDYIPPRADL